jgi:preprotein translocase subunit YajC
MLNTFLILAMAPPAGGAGQPAQSPLFMFGWLGIMIALFYFMLIRPQRRREKERQQLLSAIKSGDRVLFGGGIIGVVANVKEKTYVIKIADKTKLEVVRGAVTQVLDKGELPADVDQELSNGNR